MWYYTKLNMKKVERKLTYEERIAKYLDDQHSVLWGRFFDIESKEGRKGAQEFILDLLIDLEITNEQADNER